jgi:hypothetical protein
MATNRKSKVQALAVGAFVAFCAFTMCASDAMAQRRGGGGGASASRGGGGGGARGGGGGARGGGGGSHGGRTAQSSVSGGNRGGGNRSAGSNGGDRSRSVERNGGDRTRTSGDRTTNIGSNNNVNIEGRDVNIDVEGGCCGYRGGYGYRHPIAAGITIGAIAGSVAGYYGSYYAALPASGCMRVVRAGVDYWQCGSAYYQEAMDGDTVVYMSVEQ